MHYTYVLQSIKDGRWYTGHTGDLRARIDDHLKGRVQSSITAAHNEAPKPFLWAKTADQILASIARYAQRTLAAQSRQLISRTTGTGD